MNPNSSWFIVSDLHFHQSYLPSLRDTTAWLVSEAERINAKHILIL